MEAYPAPIPRAVKVAPTPVLDLEPRQDFTNPTEASLLAVLVTAVPASILNLAVTNPPELLSLFVSDFGDGSYPAWYTRLPGDVQCYLTEGTVCASDQIDAATSTRRPSASGTGAAGDAGLSTGAKAGIGIGVALGVLLLIGALVGCCLWMRRRKKKRVGRQSQMPAGPVAPVVVHQQHQGQKYEAVPQVPQQTVGGGGYYQKNEGYVQQQQQQVPGQQGPQPVPSPVSSYGAGFAPSPGGYEYNGGYGQQQYPPPQQGYAQGQPQPYQQHHAPPPPISQQQGPQAAELPTAAVPRPHELS